MRNTFKRKQKIDLEINTEKSRVAHLNAQQAKEEYDEAFKDYKEGVGGKHNLTPEGYNENTFIAIIRDEIHDLIPQLDSFDNTELRSIDRLWQDWCLLRIRIDLTESARYSKSDQPKTKWWFWIDRLDELSDEERSTV